jgi:hypothetical protein
MVIPCAELLSAILTGIASFILEIVSFIALLDSQWQSHSLKSAQILLNSSQGIQIPGFEPGTGSLVPWTPPKGCYLKEAAKIC